MTSHEPDKQSDHGQNPSEAKHAEIVDEVQLSGTSNKPPIHIGPTVSSTRGSGPSPNLPRRRRFRLRSNSAMGLVIVALGTSIGLLMRFVFPADQFGQMGLPPIKTPSELVKTPDLEKVKP